MAWTPERKAQFAKDMAERRAKKQVEKEASPTQTPETKTVEVEAPQKQEIIQPTSPAESPALSFTPEQLQQIIAALTGGTTDHAPAMSLSGQLTNTRGEVVGSIEKYNIDPDYYPNPIDEVTTWLDTNEKTKRFSFSNNYYLTWEITTVPYDTKFGTSVREPTFHLTLYSPLYDENGDDTGRFRVVQSLHFNEDESTAFEIAARLGFTPTHDNMREIMDKARVERIKRWLKSIFFPENNFGLNTSFNEEAIDGQVVKVITKSNVKGFGNKIPKIDFEELQ